MRQDKALINEARYPYIVQLPINSAGLELGLNRRILAFYKSRRIKPRYGRTVAEANQTFSRWCFSDLVTARAFVDEFGGVQNKRHLSCAESCELLHRKRNGALQQHK
jgi:hypothetical protein